MSDKEVNDDRVNFARLVGNRVKAIRGRESQADFAAKLGLSASAYAYYERGERVPGADTIRRIAEVTGADVAQLLGLSHGAPSSADSTVRSDQAFGLVRETGHPLPEDLVLFAEVVQALCRHEAFRDSPIKGITLLARGIYETCRETGESPGDLIAQSFGS